MCLEKDLNYICRLSIQNFAVPSWPKKIRPHFEHINKDRENYSPGSLARMAKFDGETTKWRNMMAIEANRGKDTS